jgi:hypothetical protein
MLSAGDSIGKVDPKAAKSSPSSTAAQPASSAAQPAPSAAQSATTTAAQTATATAAQSAPPDVTVGEAAAADALQSTIPSAKRSELLYSPSNPTEPMDWDQNLKGVKELMSGYTGPPATTLKEVAPPVGVPAPDTQTPSPQPLPPPQPANNNHPSMHLPSTLRAAEYLAKMKDKMVADITNRMGKDMMTYDSIRQHNIRETKAKNLIGSEDCQANLGDGMVTAGDGSLLSGGLKLVMRAKRIITSSCHSDWQCISCGPHGRRPAFKTRGEPGPPGADQAVFLGDQTIPAILPASGNELCIKIVRIENGGPLELAEEPPLHPWQHHLDIFFFFFFLRRRYFRFLISAMWASPPILMTISLPKKCSSQNWGKRPELHLSPHAADRQRRQGQPAPSFRTDGMDSPLLLLRWKLPRGEPQDSRLHHP